MTFIVGMVYDAMFSVDDIQRTFLVLNDNGDGTYDVRWNDGDEEWNYVADLERYVRNYQDWKDQQEET